MDPRRIDPKALSALLSTSGLAVVRPRVPILSIPAAITKGLGRFLWQGPPDTIHFPAIEGMPIAKTTEVRAYVSGYPA